MRRRFCVLDVDPRCAGNHGYFAEMDAELADGGLEALLYDLLAFDLDAVALRTIPKTRALLEQKERSLGSVDAWWLGRLDAGALTRREDDWRTEIPTDELFEDYVKSSDKIGVKRKREETIFGMEMHKLVPGLKKDKRTVEVRNEHGFVVRNEYGAAKTQRVRCYVMPPLKDCRDAWDAAMGQKREWTIDGEEAERESDREREYDSAAF